MLESARWLFGSHTTRAATRPLPSGARARFQQPSDAHGHPPPLNQNRAFAHAGGITKQILREGSGECPPPGSNVKAHYTGRFLDGNVFDSSVSRGRPFTFTIGIGQVIKGWDTGISVSFSRLRRPFSRRRRPLEVP